MSAKVYLVGAGPGDPDHLTLKALRTLQRAHLVLHDDLVSPEILQLVRPGAQIENVGKRCGQKRITQQEIHSRMIGAARNGVTVVRLQCGDPLVFGRAGEEMEALRRAGIEFEIVPGVTAAIAAAASSKITLAHTRSASSVIFLTARTCKKDAPSSFGTGFAPASTLVIYMPGQDNARLQNQLLASNITPTTPCVVVSRASQPGESHHFTTLDHLTEAPPAVAPAVLLVGAHAAINP